MGQGHTVEPRRHRILVVDDDRDLCELTGEYLSRAGHTVFYAFSGNEAIALMRETMVDAVITDLNMPGGNGLDLFAWIKAQPEQKARVIFLTGERISPDDDCFRRAHAVMKKPFLPKELQATVQAVLSTREPYQRQHARTNARIPIELHLAGSDRELKAQTINIGRGGAFIDLSAEQLPAIGTPVRFRIPSPYQAAATIVGEGIVRWRRSESSSGLPKGVGIEFKGLSDEHRDAVLGWLVGDGEEVF